jgi:hypothetical protein
MSSVLHTKKSPKEEIMDEITEKLIEKLQDTVNQKVQDTLKKYQDTTKKSFMKHRNNQLNSERTSTNSKENQRGL